MVKLDHEQLTTLVTMQFSEARHELAKLDLTEEQWDTITQIFYKPESFVIELLKATNVTWEVN